ncbi:hypothetical protein EDEG_03392, partial [Edhazardia aedis USNM 41457]
MITNKKYLSDFRKVLKVLRRKYSNECSTDNTNINSISNIIGNINTNNIVDSDNSINSDNSISNNVDKKNNTNNDTNNINGKLRSNDVLERVNGIFGNTLNEKENKLLKSNLEEVTSRNKYLEILEKQKQENLKYLKLSNDDLLIQNNNGNINDFDNNSSNINSRKSSNSYNSNNSVNNMDNIGNRNNLNNFENGGSIYKDRKQINKDLGGFNYHHNTFYNQITSKKNNLSNEIIKDADIFIQRNINGNIYSSSTSNSNSITNSNNINLNSRDINTNINDIFNIKKIHNRDVNARKVNCNSNDIDTINRDINPNINHVNIGKKVIDIPNTIQNKINYINNINNKGNSNVNVVNQQSSLSNIPNKQVIRKDHLGAKLQNQIYSVHQNIETRNMIKNDNPYVSINNDNNNQYRQDNINSVSIENSRLIRSKEYPHSISNISSNQSNIFTDRPRNQSNSSNANTNSNMNSTINRYANTNNKNSNTINTNSNIINNRIMNQYNSSHISNVNNINMQRNQKYNTHINNIQNQYVSPRKVIPITGNFSSSKNTQQNLDTSYDNNINPKSKIPTSIQNNHNINNTGLSNTNSKIFNQSNNIDDNLFVRNHIQKPIINNNPDSSLIYSADRVNRQSFHQNLINSNPCSNYSVGEQRDVNSIVSNNSYNSNTSNFSNRYNTNIRSNNNIQRSDTNSHNNINIER